MKAAVEIEPMPRQRCPHCSAELREETVRQDALFLGAGFGETKATTRQSCPACGFNRTVAVDSERPPR